MSPQRIAFIMSALLPKMKYVWSHSVFLSSKNGFEHMNKNVFSALSVKLHIIMRARPKANPSIHTVSFLYELKYAMQQRTSMNSVKKRANKAESLFEMSMPKMKNTVKETNGLKLTGRSYERYLFSASSVLDFKSSVFTYCYSFNFNEC